MENVKISVDQVIVELDKCILEEPEVKKALDEIFEKKNDEIEKRIIEMIEYLDMKPCSELSKENIMYFFRRYFEKWILNSAVNIVLQKNGCHDILSCIKSLIFEENLKDAIYGEVMIRAMSRAIRNIKYSGSKIILLEKKYLGKWKNYLK